MIKYLKLFLYSAFFILHSSFLFAQANNWLWASQAEDGTAGGSGVCSDMLAADNAGNCFYTGVLFWADSIHFGPYLVRDNALNYYDIYLVKFDNNGKVLWAKQSQQNGNQSDANGYVVSTDGSGNAYIMANFSDTISFDSDTLITQKEINNRTYATQDIFLTKYASAGKVVWAKQSQVASYASGLDGNSLATDQKGNSYITGLFYDTVYFGGKPVIGVLHSDTPYYTFLAKYDANGNVKWAAQSTGHSGYGSQGISVAVNNSGGVFIAGTFSDSVTFGPFKLTSPPSNGDVFLVKYDTNGNVKWARAGVFPSSHNLVYPQGLTADNFGNVYMAGYFWDTLIFADDTLINPNQFATSYNAFIVKYDSKGNVKWAKAPEILDGNGWYANALSCDNKGDIFMSGGGGTKGLCKICFGNDTLSILDSTYNDNPGFIVKYDSSGSVICASITHCGGDVDGVASDTSGNYVYWGGVAGAINIFGNDTINLQYGPVPFIARWRECEPALGVNQLEITNEKLKVYPNPSNGIFQVEISHAGLVSASQPVIEVYNVLGEQVLNETLKQVQGDNTINLSNQPNGVYLYRVTTLTGELVGEGKLVKQ